jgi:hypothetical protein
MPDVREEELREEIETCITDLKQGLVLSLYLQNYNCTSLYYLVMNTVILPYCTVFYIYTVL